MAGEWRVARVGDLIDCGALRLDDGYRVKNVELGNEGFPFVRGGDIRDDGSIQTDVDDHVLPQYEPRIRSKLAQPNDVAFITKGTVGRVGFLRDGQANVVFAPQVSYWRVLEQRELHPRFLYYLLKGREFQACLDAVRTHGSMVADYVSLRDQRDFKITIPPLRQQKAIAYILGTLDDKIELNRRMNETLEAMARAIFKSWFVDFDPVRAKMEGRKPAGMDAATAKLFPDCLVDSELGPIPKGWKARPVSDLASIVGGSTPSTKESQFWDDGQHAWATPKDLSGLVTPVLLSTERRITDAGLSQIGSGLLPPGTVLLSSRAPIGYLAVSEIPVAINQGFIAMLPAKGVSNLFLLHWAEWAHEEIVSRANGSTFLEISKANFRPIPVVDPQPPVFAGFDRACSPLYSQIVSNELESRTLAAVRDTLLPQLLSSGTDIVEPQETLRGHL